MNDALLIDSPPCPGLRLSKLEMFNWGTFDSSGGNIHTVRPHGTTALLIGQNGSGKSTVVDALLTLLVRPVVRNYNVAAGAHKQERDERTYIKGAFGRLGRDEDNRADVQYLRPDGRHYSALLACFANGQHDVLTVAQVLYLDSEGRVQKVYCLATGEKSIAADCGNLVSTDRVRQQLEKQGFRATTSYSEYHNWFAKATGVRPKAMDMFNQTVAVKDIQSLNRFIREHMLESKPWNEKIEHLQNHFTQLSEAYQSLVRVRRQYELLQPIAEHGAAYRRSAEQLTRIERLLAAADSFFRRQTVVLLQPECARAEADLAELAGRKSGFERNMAETQEEQRRLKNEMEQAGGERLRTIPLLIQTRQSQLKNARDASTRFHSDLEAAGLREKVTSAAALKGLHGRLPGLSGEAEQKSRSIQGDREKKIVDRAESSRSLADLRRELTALTQRQGNLPESFADLRRQICEHLRLPEKDLPFVAELIAVRPEERQWEPSIEMVLRSFALSLLVPQRYYAMVSAFVDRTRLADGRGKGQRLVYLRVAERAGQDSCGTVPQPTSLLSKLTFREGHALLPWVRAELRERFNFVCCQTIEEFQSTSQLALTRERHMKMRGGRHEKDDRERTTDPGSFVLGWDNRAKRQHLASEVERLDQSVKRFDDAIDRAERELERLRHRRDALDRLKLVTDFAVIDFAQHEREIRDLEQERESLEQNNDAVRVLKERLKASEERAVALSKGRDEIVGREAVLKNQLREWRKRIGEAEATLAQKARTGQLSRDEECFADCEAVFRDTQLTADNLLPQEQAYRQARREEVDALRKEIEPQKNGLLTLMGRYLREFADEQADLDTGVEYLDSFCSRVDQICRDDLPRHEARFKERLNEKVIQEIGLLNGAFQTERTEISSKIELLNQCLRQLEYRPGTYMQLEPRAVRDREVLDFQESLRQCLAGTFEGTPEADEARYVRIEKLLARLREEARWRDKVTDVRRWFDFAARELDAANGEERAYYEDSTGQSGGEKAKLAFTILVAAIAYQYDIDPGRSDDGRFRFVVVDEMFSKVDDQYSEYALELFQKFGLQLLIVAPLDAKARVTEPYVGCYLHVVKDAISNQSEIYSMTAREFEEAVLKPSEAGNEG